MASPTRGAANAGLSRTQVVAIVGKGLEGVAHGAGVVLAVSGGPDSTALAHLVTEARPDLRAAVGHVRHRLRPDRDDARVAATHAAALGLRYHEREVAVHLAGEGPEAAARRARYEALTRIARSEGASCILLGHTADDRAETLLLNLARGTGVRGLGGMAAVRPHAPGLQIVRPLLRLRRSDARAFVREEGLDAVQDPTNRDPDQRRWRAHNEVLPALARLSGGSGDPVGVLTRLADLAAEDADALDELAAVQAEALTSRWGPARALPADRLALLPAALAGRVVRRMLTSVRGTASGLTAEAVAAVLGLAPGQAVHVAKGCVVTAGGGWIAAAPTDSAPLTRRLVPVPGALPFASIGIVLHADCPWGQGADHRGQTLLDLGELAAPTLGEVGHVPPAAVGPVPPRGKGSGQFWAVLPAGEGPVAVRGRAPGDRIRLRGGRRKLQDVLVDARLPRALRDLVPIVVDAHDEPVWVPGVTVRWAPADTPAGPRLWLADMDTPTLGYAAAAGSDQA